ncbi:efflux RND transporter periplasmic adaptor subunit [Roseococcus pinisoli]|uniref:Efflux RND transporter periplasmic adaptor subunit n=1 Tax=Roseococcus pinisoli TaxID=2835040 RepID=A0ABS5QDQ2_9PROT|nr:efflux RND transporter periplasmic adaptor subunit [Roseococcus pinisoli]MBS7811603.1 efflux RND transporter periplasmic adaptor subunit [Roseococcus pinisoli]
MLSAARVRTAGLLLLAGLAACDDGAPAAAPDIRPVRVMSVDGRAGGELVSLTGTIQAETDVNLAFRIDGRMIERSVNVGDRVTAGQVVARLNRDNEESNLRAARAALAAANARVVETRNNYNRQRQLLASGFATRVRYDEATQQLQSARSTADSAQAQVNIAENRLGYTELVADSNGTVTARGAEPGEVVQPGRMILQIAQDGGRDAVFGVPASVKDRAPENPVIDVFLTTDPTIRATGRVREVSPRADPVTGTFAVRVGLAEPPAGLRLGSTVTGRMRIGGGDGYEIPASALTRIQGNPAVWIVDTATQTVSLRSVEVARFDPAGVVVSGGLVPGDVIVTAGVQALRPGQKVRLLGAAS